MNGGGRRVGGRALLAGYVADLVFGDPGRRHPVAAFGRLAMRLERLAWRPRRRAGVVYAGGLVAAAALGVGAVERPLRRCPLARDALSAWVLWAALGGRSLAVEGRALAGLVRDGELEAARPRARTLVGRDTSQLGEAELCRAAVESLAENTADAVVAPLLWCAVGGPGAATAYRAANTLDAMVGHRTSRHRRFGWAAARLDDLLTWPAARIAAGLAVALAPLAGGQARPALRALRRDGWRHPSPNAGRLEAAFAGALGVSLGGSNSYAGRVEDRPRLGGGRSPRPFDVLRAAQLSRLVGAASAAGAAALAQAVGR